MFCCSSATKTTVTMKFKAKLFAKPGPVWCNRANFLKQEVGPGSEASAGALCLTLEKSEMKKTLVALAALATVGTAFAQSTVTLYGRIDASVGRNEVKVGGTAAGAAAIAGTAAKNGFDVGSGSNSGSRWGLMGSEDIGGGLKANFVLESGFNVDVGGSAQGGLLFGRNAYVGLSGGFGEIRLGRQVTNMANYGWAVTGGYANYDAWASQAVNGGFGNFGSIATDNVRKNNAISYFTPNMGGFTAGLMIAPGENGTVPGIVGGRGNSTYYSPVLDYTNGPIQVNFTYESDRVLPGTQAIATSAANLTGATFSQKQWVLAGKYDFGVVALGASIERATLQTDRDKGYALSLTAPVGPVNLAFEYAREETTTAGAFTSRANALNFRASYPLSKRTDIYAFVSDGNSKANAGGTQHLSRYRVGLRHAF
jgi:predicted porin